MIHWNVEKTLDLLGVEIHRQYSGRAGDGDEIGNQFRRDWNTGLVFPVLTGVSVIRNDRRYSGGGRAFGGVYHYEPLHQALIGGETDRLDDEYIRVTYVLTVFHEGFTIGKSGYLHIANWYFEMLADILRQSPVGGSGEYKQFLRYIRHCDLAP
jgi:hypothetical protein